MIWWAEESRSLIACSPAGLSFGPYWGPTTPTFASRWKVVIIRIIKKDPSFFSQLTLFLCQGLSWGACRPRAIRRQSEWRTVSKMRWLPSSLSVCSPPAGGQGCPTSAWAKTSRASWRKKHLKTSSVSVFIKKISGFCLIPASFVFPVQWKSFSTSTRLLKCWRLFSQSPFHLTWNLHRDSRQRVKIDFYNIFKLLISAFQRIRQLSNSSLQPERSLFHSCVQASLWPEQEGDRENPKGGEHASATRCRLLLSANLSESVSGGQGGPEQISTEHSESLTPQWYGFSLYFLPFPL